MSVDAGALRLLGLVSPPPPEEEEEEEELAASTVDRGALKLLGLDRALSTFPPAPTLPPEEKVAQEPDTAVQRQGLEPTPREYVPSSSLVQPAPPEPGKTYQQKILDYLNPAELGKRALGGTLAMRDAVGEAIGQAGVDLEAASGKAAEEGMALGKPVFQLGEAVGQQVQTMFPPDAPPLQAPPALQPTREANLADSVAESLPNFLGIIGSTIAAGPAGGLAVAGASEWGNQYRGARERGASEEEARVSATIYSGAAAALEYTGAAKALEKALPGAGKDAIQDLTARWLAGAAAEGATETTQEVTSELVDLATFAGEKGFGVEDLRQAFSEENLRRYGRSGVVGFILGGAPALTSAGKDAPESPPAPASPREAPIVKYRAEAQRISAALASPSPGTTRLWRGNRPEGDVGINPRFTDDLPGIALPFAEAYGGPISYVDVPSEILPRYASENSPAEYRLPEFMARAAQIVEPSLSREEVGERVSANPEDVVETVAPENVPLPPEEEGPEPRRVVDLQPMPPPPEKFRDLRVRKSQPAVREELTREQRIAADEATEDQGSPPGVAETPDLGQEMTSPALEVVQGEGVPEAPKAPPAQNFRSFVESQGVEWDSFTPTDPRYGDLRSRFQEARKAPAEPVVESEAAAEPTVAEEPQPTLIERLPAARSDEAGFAKTLSRSLVQDIKIVVDRQIKPQGNLPVSAWKLKLQKDHNLGAHEKGLEYRLRELNQKIRSYEGPLTRKQLTRYLGDALRGNVPLDIRAETASFDEAQIQRIAEKRGLDPESVRSEFERAGERPVEGLPSAREFVPLVAKLRADIDAVTRSLRREGLLDDAAARDLERSAGLYVHRSYEAFQGKSKAHLRKVEETPLWNRAKELIAKEHPDFTPEEVDGFLREFIERGDKATLPGNVPEGALNRSTLFQRQGVRDLERLLLGERRDVRSQAMDTLIGQVSLLEHHRFLKALREDGLGKYLFERPSGRYYRNIDEVATPVPILEEEGQPATIYRKGTHRRYGEMTASGKPGGKALHTTPEILRELEDAMPKASEWPLWLKVWSLGNFAVKTNLTVLSPTTTGRNYLSNVFAAMANGYTPWGGGIRAGKTLVFRDIANSSSDEIRAMYQKFVRLGIVDQGTDYGDLRRLGAFADLMRSELDPGARPVSWAKTFIRKAGQIYQHGDNFWKILGWSQERARLEEIHPEWSAEKLDQEAAKIVQRVLQNYSQLPRLARSISANPVVAPFFSFTWSMFRNVKETSRQAATEIRSEDPRVKKIGYRRAAGLIAALALPDMLTFALRYMSNTDDEDDRALREFVYPWDRGSSLGIVHHKPGEYTYFNWGFMDYFSRLKEPVRLALQAARGDREPEEAVGDVFADYGEEVLLGALIDVARGETSDGRRVWLEREKGTMDQVTKSMAHLWDTARPGVARNVENLNEAASGTGNRKLWAEIAALAGPRFTTVNVSDRLDSFGGHFSRSLGESTRVYSQYANRSSNPGNDKLLHGYERANEERIKLLLDLRRKMEAGVVSGLSVDRVEELLVAGGAPKKYIEMAWGGEFEPVGYDRGKHWEAIESELAEIASRAVLEWEKEIAEEAKR